MQCSHLKKDNTQCQAKAMQNARFCFRHNPATVDEQKEASARGGKHNKVLSLDLRPVSLRSPEAVLEVIEEAVNLVRSGQMPTNTANTIGFLVQHSMKVLEVIEKNKTHQDRIEDRAMREFDEDPIKAIDGLIEMKNFLMEIEKDNQRFEKLGVKRPEGASYA